MALRKWLVRGLVYSALSGMGLTALLYQTWTNPTAMRRLVLEKLSEKFTGAVVSMDSAKLWPFGFIAVHELRMARRDDLDRNDFLYAPSVMIRHDKEHFLEGHLAIQRVEMKRPHLRIIRYRDGRTNLNDILCPPNINEHVPMIVLHQATITVEDQSSSKPGIILEMSNVNLTITNDPLPILHLEATAETDVAGPIHLTGYLCRSDAETSATLEATAIPIGPALVDRLSMLAPRIADQVRELSGTGKVKVTLVKHGGNSAGLSYDINAELHRGALTHPRLPLRLEQIEATARVQDGRVPQAHLAARSGKATIDLSIKDGVLPAGGSAQVEDLARELDVQVEHLPVDATLLASLPPEMQQLQPDYKPTGPVTLTHTFRREARDRWRKHWVFQPEGMSVEFFKFRYPVQGITGSIEREATSDQRHTITLNLAGAAGGRPIRLMGRLEGEKTREKVEIDLWGDDVPIDDVLLNALPAQSRALAARFNLSGRTDINAQIRRVEGQHEFANRFSLRVHDAGVRFDQFPYPVEKASCLLDILPDHWECKDFRGTHKGGEIRVWGRSVPLAPDRGTPDSQDRHQRVEVNVSGSNVLLDEEFESALAPPGVPRRAALEKAWRMLALAGRLSFAAEVVDLPNQPQDIDVGVTVHGCAMQPRFFPLLLQDVSGAVHYARDEVRVTGVKARHGTSVLGLREGRVLLKPGGGFQARLAGVTGNPLIPDRDFIAALPHPLRMGLEQLKLHDPIGVDTQLVVDVSPEPGALPLVYWDGSATLHNVSLKTGIELTGVDGEVACRGRHNGRALEGVVGNILLKQATLLKQPITNLSSEIMVAPDSPDVLCLKNFHADWFGGTLGGEARVQFAPLLRYEAKIEAAQVRLEEFVRQNAGARADVQGAASAGLHLTGEGAGVGGLKGHGRVDVPDGKLYRLPLLLDLIKAFGLRVPDRTAFEQASMVFKIDGPEMEIQQINLLGNAISLRGQGTVNLDGSDLNLDFYADWARALQILPPVFNGLPRAVSDRLFKIRVHGRVGGDIRFDKEVVPVVTEPIKRALGQD